MECKEVYNLDNNTQLMFLRPKIVIVIDKPKFLVCKQLMMENAQDDEIASFLEIPVEKVRFFKFKMAMWENKLRAKKRENKHNSFNESKNTDSKLRFKKARELISRNFSTSEISRILKMSERSVTRFRKRMREEKNELKAQGKLHLDPNDSDNSFKYLQEAEKLQRASQLFEQGLGFTEISEICKVSERTVRRWKERLFKMEQEPIKEIQYETAPIKETTTKQQPRQRRSYYDREKIEYATELMQNGLSNKEMSMLLELSIANVRKLKVNILKGTVNELIDDSAEHYSKLNGGEERDDPLDGFDGASVPVAYGSRRKPKVNLTDREMHLVRLLRDKGVRTMDIAKMIDISERSVTRLLTKSKEQNIHEYEYELLEEVERLMAQESIVVEKTTEIIEEIEDVPDEIMQDPKTFSQNFISKSRIGMDLIRMNVKSAEIAKMLEIPIQQVYKWKKQVKLFIVEEKKIDTFIIEEVAINDTEEYLETV